MRSLLNPIAWTIRKKILLIFLFILAPSAGLLVADNLGGQREAVQSAEDKVLLLVESLAEQQERIAYGTRIMLTTLSRLPEFQRLDIQACREIFQDLIRQYPFYITIGLATPDGNLIADARPLPTSGTVNLSEQKHIKDAINKLDFSVGEFIVGKVSKVATIHYSYPVLDPDKNLKGIIIAGFNLSEYATLIRNSKLLNNWAFSITDHRGVRLYRLPEDDAVPPGKPIPSEALEQMSGDSEHGIFERVSDDGIRRLYAFKRLRLSESSAPYLYLLAGVAKEQIVHKANITLMKNLSILCFFTLLAIGAAWAFANFSLIRPMSCLSLTIQRFGSGELGTRTGLGYTPDEIGLLAKTFDEMASFIEKSEDERRQLGEKLHEEEKKYRSLVENSHDIIFTITADGRLTFVSPAWTTLLGHSVEEVIGKNFRSFVHPDDVPRCLEFLQGIVAENRRLEGIEFRVKHQDGTWYWHSSSGVPIRDDGVVTGMYGIGRDITERRQAEHALKESERKYHKLFEVESDALFLIEAETLSILDVNSSAESLYGYTRDDLLSMTYLNVSAQKEESGRTIMEETDHVSMRWHRKKDGTVFPVEIAVTSFDLEGKGVYLAAVRDITGRMEAEQALFRQNELQRVLLSTIPACVYVKDAESMYQLANKGFGRLCGAPENEIPGRTDYDFFPVTVAERFRKTDAEVVATGNARVNYEERGTDGNGNEVWFSTSTCPFYGPSGEVSGLVGISIDITDRKRAEEERLRYEERLRQAQKAESLARMAGAIAHNFNNLLAAVIGNLDLAQDEVSDGSELQTCINEALHASQRAASISRFMLTYLGQTAGKAESVDPASAVREVCSLLSGSMLKNVRLKAEVSAQGFAIKADGAHLTQILTNLIENAVEAIGEQEGEVALAIDTIPGAEIQERKLFPLDWEPRSEEYARISIADTGCGIEPEQLDMIFDPFFSTKFTGRGLGLAVVLGLLRTADGAIGVESYPGRGTSFKLFFPLAEHAKPVSIKQEPVSRPADRSRLILVVDDEDTVRNMASAMLKRRLELDVITARNGSEALEIFKERREEVALVLLDLSMPGMNGWETLTALRALRSDIPVILSSGYDEAQVNRGEHLELPQTFLSKPYGAKELKMALAAALQV